MKVLLVSLFFATAQATAEKIPCWQVKYYILIYGRAAVID